MFNFEFIFEFDMFNNIKFNNNVLIRKSFEFMNLKILLLIILISKKEVMLI